MKLSEAVITLLTLWTCSFSISHDMKDSLLELFLRDFTKKKNHKDQILYQAIMVIFGTQTPKPETISSFIDHYADWMMGIYANTPRILLGEVTVVEVILDQVIKETWL